MSASRSTAPPTRRQVREQERAVERAAELAAQQAAAELVAEPDAEVASRRARTAAAPAVPTSSRRGLREVERAAVRAASTTRRKLRSFAVAALAIVVAPATLVVGSAYAEPGVPGGVDLTAGQSATKDSGLSITDGAATVAFKLGGRPAGNSLYLGLELRRSGSSFYRTKVRVTPSGSVLAGISRIVDGKETGLGTVRLPVVVPAASSTLNVQGYVAGAGPVKLGVRAWLQGSALPAYQLVKNDTTAASSTGRIRSWAYLSTMATAKASVLAGPVTTPATEAAAPVTTPTATPGTTPSSTPSATPGATPTSTPSTPSAPAARPTATETTRPSTGSSSSSGARAGGRPSADNTGVPDGTKLTQHYGDMVITKDGTTLDKLDIHGFVKVSAKNVTITNSIVRGGTASGNLGLVTVLDPARDFVIEDSTLVPEHPSVWLDNLKGNNFTARRINAYGGVDAVKVHGNDVLVEDSYLHGNQWYANDPNQGGTETHNDGIEVVGGSNITFRNNTIVGGNNSALQVTQDYAPTKNLVFTGNWASGGDCTLNITNKGRGGGGAAMGPIPVKNNVFGANLNHTGKCAITHSAATTLDLAGNSWAADSQNADTAVAARTAG